MAEWNMSIREVDGVEIISLVDNSVDFVSSTGRDNVQQVRKWIINRMGEKWVKQHFRLPTAEHGFSMLVHVFLEGKSHTILFDAGISPSGAVTNAENMGLDLTKVEAVVLSHGHYDHFGGLVETVKAIGKKDLPIIVHEDMFKVRGVAEQNGTVRKYRNFPTEEHVKPAQYVKTKKPYLLADYTILITGEIPREIEFEKGYPQQRAFIDGKWLPDPEVWDDRALIIKVKQKGSVVISGCAHAGIINTTLYAQKITGSTEIHAILGGFHLAGKDCESRIEKTVKDLKRLDPELIVPSHCTGWRGIFAIADAMPQAFVWNSVGNLYEL
jgi:7,8-dihydropterin-6-yl-methyl-4-(beta-D-ribofuranosyl)aminobenzene 5'-phosphate synthase